MDFSKIYNELLQLRKSAFKNLDDYFIAQQSKGYLTFLNHDDANGMIEFKTGQFHFLIQSEIIPFSRQVVYKIYLRKLDLTYYPTNVFTNEHLDLDIIGWGSHGIHSFVKEQQQLSSFQNYTQRVATKEIEDFALTIIDQVEQVLLKRYPPIKY